MTAAEYQDAGRLSRKRLTGLWPFGWSPAVSIGQRPTNDPSWRLQGAVRRTSPAALRLAPPRRQRKPRCGMQGNQYRRPAAGSLRSMVSAGQRPARGARRAPSLSGRGVFPAPRPHAFSCDCSQVGPSCKGALRPVLAVLTRSFRCAPGCGFRAAPGWPLHLGPTWLLLVARHGAHAKQEKQKHPRPERTPNEDSGVFLKQEFLTARDGINTRRARRSER